MALSGATPSLDERFSAFWDGLLKVVNQPDCHPGEVRRVDRARLDLLMNRSVFVYAHLHRSSNGLTVGVQLRGAARKHAGLLHQQLERVLEQPVQSNPVASYHTLSTYPKLVPLTEPDAWFVHYPWIARLLWIFYEEAAMAVNMNRSTQASG